MKTETTSIILVIIIISFTYFTVAAKHSTSIGHSRVLAQPNDCSVPRGGATSNEEEDDEDEELDAYIHTLISSVDSSEEGDESRIESGDSDHEETKEEKENEDDAHAAEDESEVSLEEENNEVASHCLSTKTNGTKTKRKRKTKASKPATTSEGSSQDTIQEPASNDQTAAVNVDNSALPKRRERRPPPNSLYRFLLHQGGVVGHVLVMFLILCAQFIETYLPLAAHLLAWMGSRLTLPHRAAGERAPNMAQIHTATVSSRRTGQSGKQRRALTKQADAVALAHLKQIGNIEQAKYRLVSLEFQKRHGLGTAEDETLRDETSIHETMQPSSGKTKRRKRSNGKKARAVDVDDHDKDDDVDWVIQALTKDYLKSDPKTSSPKSALWTNSFDATRHQAVLDAIACETKSTSTVGPRASDQDGGDGFFGRLRVASGANSLVSRSLLGAYPRDAVSPEEAASSMGVTELAERYGWGDWSDDDEGHDEDDNFLVQKKSKRKRRRRRSSSGVSIEFSLSSSGESPTRSPARNGIRERAESVSFSSRASFESPTSVASTPREEIERRRVRAAPKPALERINKLRNDDDS